MKVFPVAVFVLLLWGEPSLSAQPTIPKEKIPVAMPEDLRGEILKLYSSDPIERAHAAERLGRGVALSESGNIIAEVSLSISNKAATPFLVAMLGDYASLRWEQFYRGGLVGFRHTSPGREAADALVKIGRPAVDALIVALSSKDEFTQENALEALKAITKREFGTNIALWRSWWEREKQRGRKP